MYTMITFLLCIYCLGYQGDQSREYWCCYKKENLWCCGVHIPISSLVIKWVREWFTKTKIDLKFDLIMALFALTIMIFRYFFLQ